AARKLAPPNLAAGPTLNRKPRHRAIALLLPWRRTPLEKKDNRRLSLLLDAVKDRRTRTQVGKILEGIGQGVVQQRPPGYSRRKIARSLQRVACAGQTEGEKREIPPRAGILEERRIGVEHIGAVKD